MKDHGLMYECGEGLIDTETDGCLDISDEGEYQPSYPVMDGQME